MNVPFSEYFSSMKLKMVKSVWIFQIFLLFILQHRLINSLSPISSLSHGHLCRREESIALFQFKQQFSIDGNIYCDSDAESSSYPKTMSWNRSTDCCTWDGITCNSRTGHVTGLDLSCSQLQGTIHVNSTLFQLLHLQRLNLAFNDFSFSSISSEIGRFASTLTYLNLSNCGFSGKIPSEISHLSKLIALDLSTNGQSPFKLGSPTFKMLLQNLTQLSELSLSSVDISSVLPTILSSSLSFLDLSWTGLHGPLPANLLQLPNLQRLDLSNNQNLTGKLPEINLNTSSPLRWLDLSLTGFFGEVPDSFGYLKSLTYLSLSGCKFSGSIPASVWNFTQITTLDISENNFSGNIPFTLSNLQQLTLLDMSTNNFQGQIPDVFSSLRNLRTLRLRENRFNGPFPSSVVNLKELVELDFAYNSLIGPLPSEATGLQNLTVLILLNNSLSGTIPSWVFSLPSLETLHLNSNQLSGPIVDFQSESLQIIDLSSNELSGPIPRSIPKLVNLNSLYLQGNNLSGVVELDMFSYLINLQYLDLSYNNLTVYTAHKNLNASLVSLDSLRLSSCKLKEFPNFLQACENLRLLDLCHNEIKGQIPNWMHSMWGDSLEYLNISHNLITGTERVPWKNLGILGLRSNLLQGPLPSSICDLTSLEILDMANNNMDGVIPQCLGNFSDQITILNLRANKLSGTIPTTFAKGNRLRNLNFNGNLLEGRVPRSLANCQALEFLDLGNNHLNDTFPQWLEALPELQVLVLRSNRFVGPIRSISTTGLFPKLRIIDLSHNEFSGPLPAKYIGSFGGMMNLNLNNMTQKYMGEESYHDYYDSMTVVMKGLGYDLDKIFTAFTVIDLSANKFEGEIPHVIGNLNSLKVLNLSHNNLGGKISPNLGNLSALESLDLSSNQLVGEIPQQLTRLTSLAVLNFSQNHLVGRIPPGPQFNTYGNDSYIGNSGLCGFPLSKSCLGDEKPPSPGFEQEGDSEFAGGFTWKAVLMGYGSGTIFGLVVGYLMLLTGKPKWFNRIVEAEESRIVNRRKKRIPIRIHGWNNKVAVTRSDKRHTCL